LSKEKVKGGLVQLFAFQDRLAQLYIYASDTILTSFTPKQSLLQFWYKKIGINRRENPAISRFLLTYAYYNSIISVRSGKLMKT